MRHETLEEHWRYNCEDCVRTLEIATAGRRSVQSLHLGPVDEFQQSMFEPVLTAMITGVKVDLAARAAMDAELVKAIAERMATLEDMVGHYLNPRSPKQMKELFYGDFRQSIITSRTTGAATLNEEALDRLANREPILRPLVKTITQLRSLGVFLSTFVRAELDEDERMRSSYNICGTETYRFSSSANAFGSGTNLQNLPEGNEDREEQSVALPNVRKIFIPDAGRTFFNLDLDRADLQVVVWEIDDANFKALLRSGLDVHTENAKLLGVDRHLAKVWCHATNYGAGAHKMAVTCGITVRDAERMQKRWFEAHPGIPKWHERISSQLRIKHAVENRFGYRRFYFDRVDGILGEALAWIPQSTVAIAINKIWRNIYRRLPEVQVLLQVHDSLAGQFPTEHRDALLPRIRECVNEVVVPYDDPLVIPATLAVSEESWGACEEL